MKLYAILTILAVGLAFSAGYLSLSLRNVPRSTNESINEVLHLKNKFKRDYRPVTELNIDSLFPVSEAKQLISPSGLYAQSRRHSFRDISKLYRYSKSCAGPTDSVLRSPHLEKSWVWYKFNCGAIKKLPSRFFETGSSVSVLGGSFAFLATQSPDRIAIDESWVQAYLPFFHVLEFPLLSRFALAIDLNRRILASLDSDSLRSISSNEEFIIGAKYVFLREPPIATSEDLNAPARPNSYLIFQRDDWDRALSISHFRTDIFEQGQLCLLKDGLVCWRLNTDEALRNFEVKTLILFVLAVLMSGICVWIAVHKFRQQNIEEERKRFALQTLTHELRTPLASLVVGAERLLDHYDELPESLQETAVRVCDDTQRLHRLAEVSKHYLGTESAELVRFNFQQIPSVNGYLRSVVEPFNGVVHESLLDQDCPFVLDSYWVGICIKNLVENALRHGRPPVGLRAQMFQSALEISVEDSGHGFTSSLSKMSRPFQKGSSSSGLGLGLSIVIKVLDAMGADLEFEPKPSRFKVRFQERERGEP